MEQQPLFLDPPQPAPLAADTEAVARAERERAPEREVSEAAEDQGWGDEKASLPPAPPALQRRPFEMPGRNRGRVNSYDQPVTPSEARRGMTPRHIQYQRAVNEAGIAAARAVLNRDKDS